MEIIINSILKGKKEVYNKMRFLGDKFKIYFYFTFNCSFVDLSNIFELTIILMKHLLRR
jgi:hypothetical protein